jgi:hypothetical protein
VIYSFISLSLSLSYTSQFITKLNYVH